MEFAINAKAAFAPKRTGVEEYVYQLVRHWLGQTPADYWQFYTDRWPADGQPLTDFFGAALPAGVSFKLLRAPRLWTQLRLSAELFVNRPDVFFNPEQKLPLYAPRRSVITVHDLGYEHFPEAHAPLHFRYLRATTRAAVKRAAAVIAVSENTKRDLITFYRAPAGKIVVVPHGFAPPIKNAARQNVDRLERQSLTKALPFYPRAPYFLYVGRLEIRKNLINLIRAFELLKLRHQLPHYLVLAGEPGFGYLQIKRAIVASPAETAIFETGYVAGQFKFQLLAKAAALILTSYYEGFGLPILEAQAQGVPVVAANTSSLPEVAGRGAVFVSPNDVEAAAAALAKFVTFPQFRAHHIQHGFENVRRFSWRRSAQETLAVLKAVSRGRVYF